MSKSIEQRVRDGATFLDTQVVGWVDRIDVDTFDLGDCMLCVLGQLFGNFHDVHMPEHEIVDYGFQGYSTDDAAFLRNADVEEMYRALTAAWRTLIIARRADRDAAEPVAAEEESLT